VTIRANPREGLLLRSLLYSLRAQGRSLPNLKVDFVLIPTEQGSAKLLREIQKGGCASEVTRWPLLIPGGSVTARD
jgi:hypothetical protein